MELGGKGKKTWYPVGAMVESWCGKSKRRLRGTRQFEIALDIVIEASPMETTNKERKEKKKEKNASKYFLKRVVLVPASYLLERRLNCFLFFIFISLSYILCPFCSVSQHF